MQVCVPEEWTDEEAVEFAEKEYPCGTENGWLMRHTGDPSLNGWGERTPCEEFPGNVHITFDA